MIVRILSAVSVAAIAGGIAIAQDDMTPQTTAPSAEEMTVPPQNVLDALAVTTKDDAREYGQKEFTLADADADGKISQDEFVAFAAAQLEYQSAEDAATLASAETPVEGATVASDVAETVVAEAEPVEEAATDEPTPEELFAALSDGKDTINEKTLIKARLASFDEADANDDNALDDAEKAQFAALVWGKASS